MEDERFQGGKKVVRGVLMKRYGGNKLRKSRAKMDGEEGWVR